VLNICYKIINLVCRTLTGLDFASVLWSKTKKQKNGKKNLKFFETFNSFLFLCEQTLDHNPESRIRIRIKIKPWIWIRICIKADADPKYSKRGWTVFKYVCWQLRPEIQARAQVNNHARSAGSKWTSSKKVCSCQILTALMPPKKRQAPHILNLWKKRTLTGMLLNSVSDLDPVESGIICRIWIW